MKNICKTWTYKPLLWPESTRLFKFGDSLYKWEYLFTNTIRQEKPEIEYTLMKSRESKKGRRKLRDSGKRRHTYLY